MVIEYRIQLDGVSHPVIISDEPEALLAAQAAGRAIIGVQGDGNKWYLKGVSYVIPGFEDASRELAQLVLRRHLGLPWLIASTGRLVIREFVEEDADHIPEEEYGAQEGVFRSRELLALYIDRQYGFYEYGTWALTEKETDVLVGMAGVSNPRLPEEMEELLYQNDPDRTVPWLELGYHIFRPYRRRGYGAEAVSAIMDYAHEVLDVRLCALIDEKNQASRAMAERLGMECIRETRILPPIREADNRSPTGDAGTQPPVRETGNRPSQGQLLYAERWISPPDREDP